MDFRRLEKRIKVDEGFRSHPYLDTAVPPVPTIGYGTTMIMGEPVTMETPPISEDAAAVFLRADIYDALKRAQDIFPRFNEMNDVRQEVLVNMAYNLGNRLRKFKNLRAAARNLSYPRMADEMRDSLWYSQVGYRAIRLTHEMRTGVSHYD